jgi:hypothetical protein
MLVLFSAVVFLAIPALFPQQTQEKCCPKMQETSCPMHEKHTQESPADEHDRGVKKRGEHAMGFSQDKTTHHFRLYPDGGAIEVEANDPKDTASRDQIRMHLTHIVKAFSEGDFNIPIFTHGLHPPGADVMKKLRSEIAYKFVESGRGARVRITTRNPAALAAVYQFLRFQISDHHTGDTTEVTSPQPESHD